MMHRQHRAECERGLRQHDVAGGSGLLLVPVPQPGAAGGQEKVTLVLADEHLMHILQEISGICFLIFSAKILKK